MTVLFVVLLLLAVLSLGAAAAGMFPKVNLLAVGLCFFVLVELLRVFQKA